jgi:hypothetical protein
MADLTQVAARETHKASEKPILVHLGWFSAAVLFVAVLYLSYGLDLSPGFF